MNNSRLLDNETISVQLRNVSARVSKGDFIDFIRVQPNFALAAFEDGSGKALLQTERDCVCATVQDNTALVIKTKTDNIT